MKPDHFRLLQSGPFDYAQEVTDKDARRIIHRDADIMGGAPVFVGTRVPLQNLIDALEGGESIDEFLEAFPAVKREQVLAVIEAGKLRLLESV